MPDARRHLAGALRRLADVADDPLGRRTLLPEGGRDGPCCGVDFPDAFRDLRNGVHRLPLHDPPSCMQSGARLLRGLGSLQALRYRT